MARSPEEYADFQAHILNSVKHYRDVQKKESDFCSVPECLIRLEGLEVTDFSSQYGSESTISYVACNLAGKACVFPSYGDYTQACVFRTYGPWWNIAPSSIQKYKGTPCDFVSQDFIEVTFAEYLYPVRIEVYETYNPGSIIRILACDRAGGTDTDKGRVTWVTLWKSQPKPSKQRPRIFAPHLKKINFATNLIRLELNHDCLDYYTELDGIKLIGTKMPPGADIHFLQPVLTVDDDDIILACDDSGMSPCCPEPVSCQQLEDETLKDSMTELSLKESEFFTLLPKEIIHLILGYLDVRDLCRLSQTCRLLKEHCYEPYLYTDLNLQPYWTQISSSSLLALEHRCDRLQRLNLSWVGKAGFIHLDTLVMFLSSCCHSLSTLELCSCNFVNGKVLASVVNICHQLTELNLNGCVHIDEFTVFNTLTRTKLKRLNLYRTKVDAGSFLAVLRSSPDLEHLNIGSCQLLNASINTILLEIGLHCKKLKSLDLWRMKSLTDEGLAHLYNNCCLLEELDIGWCGELKADRDSYYNLAKHCRNLKKLFLTANRTLRDTDLRALADHCPLLEQLDILGTREVSRDAIVYTLETSKNLMFLDVSFCLGISTTDVCCWRATYPHVSIKKSFQNISIT